MKTIGQWPQVDLRRTFRSGADGLLGMMGAGTLLCQWLPDEVPAPRGLDIALENDVFRLPASPEHRRLAIAWNMHLRNLGFTANYEVPLFGLRADVAILSDGAVVGAVECGFTEGEKVARFLTAGLSTVIVSPFIDEGRIFAAEFRRCTPQEATMHKLEAAFWLFHHENPHVYAVLVKLAREWIAARGKHKLGMVMLFQRARWEIEMTTKDEFGFKLNNNHVPFYARLIMDQEPDLAGVFNLRRQTVQSSFGPSNDTLPDGDHVS